MDIKLGGIAPEILKEALYQAKDGREHILAIMERAARDIIVNEAILPKFDVFTVDTSKMVDIIGQGGKTIKEIIEKFTVTIDLNRENGEVKLSGASKPQVEAAKEHILNIVKNAGQGRGGPRGRDGHGHGHDRDRREPQKIVEFEKGAVYEGVVKRIADFGAFVGLPGDVDGLLHISKLGEGRVAKVTDVVNIGDKVRVKVLFQKGPKIELGFEGKE
jgi:polyribonucleotide nucleotidyltransferase